VSAWCIVTNIDQRAPRMASVDVTEQRIGRHAEVTGHRTHTAILVERGSDGPGSR
jgi:hypothetical protein